MCHWQSGWLTLGCPVQPPLVYKQDGMGLSKELCISTRYIIDRALYDLVLLLVSVRFKSL